MAIAAGMAIAMELAGPLRAQADAAPYSEPWRPQFHYSPARHWMNDPNGLVWADGEWHLFYQYYPGASVWGPMHWGHAVSRDLLHWQELPVALAPDARGMVFSGSIVDDKHNTSGFGRGGRAPLVAMYTIHDEARKARGLMGYESQGLAYSTDAGRTWRRYAHNPVLSLPTQPDFRDPKPFWHEATKRWVVVLATGDHVGIYSSGNLRHWRHESDFGAGLGAHAGVWECPDLLPLPYVDGTRWLLLVSVGEGAPNGGSGTQYFVGDFDGHAFRLDEPRGAQAARGVQGARWVDFGTDNYAGSTWTGSPPGDGRTLFLGWMSNWQYATRVPTTAWRSAMTLPRELSLAAGANGPELRSMPARELQALRRQSVALEPRQASEPIDLLALAGARGGLYELELEVSGGFSLRLGNALGQHALLSYEPAMHRYVFERAAAGETGFAPRFADPQYMPVPDDEPVQRLRLFIDTASLEAFANDGASQLSVLLFPDAPWDSLVLQGNGATLRQARVHELATIWRQ